MNRIEYEAEVERRFDEWLIPHMTTGRNLAARSSWCSQFESYIEQLGLDAKYARATGQVTIVMDLSGSCAALGRARVMDQFQAYIESLVRQQLQIQQSGLQGLTLTLSDVRATLE